MAKEIKELPSEGKIKRVSKYVMILVTIAWALTTVSVLTGMLTVDEAQSVGVLFDSWWKVMGSFLLLLSANDNGVKFSTAMMNRNG